LIVSQITIRHPLVVSKIDSKTDLNPQKIREELQRQLKKKRKEEETL